MDQLGRSVPPVSPESYGKRMWRLWGPIVIKWAIEIGISTLAMMALAMASRVMCPELFAEAIDNQDKMAELYNQIMEIYMKSMTLIQGISALVVIPVMLFLFYGDGIHRKKAGIVPNKKAALWKYPAVILIAAAMCLGLNNLINIGNLSVVDETYVQTIEALYSASLPVQIISLGILTPVSEELVFRGLLFQRLRERGTYMQAAVFSSVVFGLMHMNLVQMIYGFVMGMLLAYVYEKYGSVKAPILAHMTMNILSVAATSAGILEWMMEDIMRIGTVTVICAAVAATMFVLIQRIDETPDIPGPEETNEKPAAV